MLFVDCVTEVAPEGELSPDQLGSLLENLQYPMWLSSVQFIVRTTLPVPSVEGLSARFALASGLVFERVIVWGVLSRMWEPSASVCVAYARICHVPDERLLRNS